MTVNQTNKPKLIIDPYQKAFERWCNRHVGCEWHEYKHGSWKPQLIHAHESKLT